ncbi:hypothetical protein JTE88_06505 [Arcanobacterium phocisimile]|uniref:Uncharacterized protein n=1 Tax=Arcanobacterium phocisimile TaxID=1302235 RepID=A0ABX7IFL0_9ACTO|nr:DUF6350 family protein [Arcanobacterium phocisimile]QRV01742.1 hypothetical protein JTE88_06505 [Arcanobacterium phocisimile]
MNTHIDLSRYWYIFRGGISAPFFTWFAVFLTVMVFYTLNASAQMMGDIVWQDAAFFATGWWTTIFGGSVTLGEAAITFMPTTLTVLASYASYQVWRTREISTWLDALAAALSWPAVVAVLALVGRAPGDWWFALIGAILIAGATALWAGREKLLYPLPWWRYVADSSRYLTWFGVGIVALAVTTTLVMLGTGFPAIIDVHSYYRTGIIGSIGLVLLQLLYLPSFVVWFYSWLVGSGFAVGEGTNFSTLGVDAGPLPAIPVFGALPAPGSSLIWLFVAVIVVALGYGIVLGRFIFREQVSLGEHMMHAGIAMAICSLGVSIISFTATGALGPGRMAVAGPVPALTAGFTVLVIAVPVLAGLLVIHPHTIAWARAQMNRETPKTTKLEGTESSAAVDPETVPVPTPGSASTREPASKTASEPELEPEPKESHHD